MSTLLRTLGLRSFFSLLGLFVATPLMAQTMGQPVDGGLGLQPAANWIARDINDFHNMLLVIITVISLFVLALLLWVMIRYRASANPNPSRTTHHTLVEVLWTVVPVIILVVIAVPSFRLLYAQDVIPETDMTVKVIGKQWYWTYEYEHPEAGVFEFDSIPLDEEEAAAQNLPRLLATDTALVLPVNTPIRVLVTAGDVLHAFTVPAFGMKRDAVPGRLNEAWIAPIEQEGVYYGQCSELCGTAHYNMPIMVKVVSKQEFKAWLDGAAEEYAGVEINRETELAALKKAGAAQR